MLTVLALAASCTFLWMSSGPLKEQGTVTALDQDQVSVELDYRPVSGAAYSPVDTVSMCC